MILPSPDRAVRALLCAAVLTLPAAHARDLAPIDALAQAPLAAQRKSISLKSATGAPPANVQRLQREERLGVPTFVQLSPAPISGLVKKALPKDPETVARDTLKSLANLYGLTPEEIDAAPLHHVHAMSGGSQLVRLTNQRDGIEVFREQATVLLNGQRQPTAIGGYLGSTATPAALGARASVANAMDASNAIAIALLDFGFSADVKDQLQALQPTTTKTGGYQHWSLPPTVTGDEGASLAHPARAKPVWFRLPDGLVSAFYVEVQVREDDEEHAYAYVIARDDGRLLFRHNQTSHASDYHYRVWADPVTKTPLPGPQGRHGTPHPTGTPNGYVPPLESASLVSLSQLPFSATAPWLDDNATTTSGNNVLAFANLVLPNGLQPGDEANCSSLSSRDLIGCTTTAHTFDHPYNHDSTPLADATQVSASVVNLFYTNNWLHDWFYDAGFDEAAGNAQKVNYGSGGLDGDALIAQALDASGTNNANMSTPADGKSPTMRMYSFTNRSGQVTVQSPASLTLTGKVAVADFGLQTFDYTHLLATTPATWPAANDACTSLVSGSLTGKIALVSRGGCEFSLKAKNVQDAGAVGIIVVNNLDIETIDMGAGTYGAGVTIPALHVTKADGNALQQAGGVSIRMVRSARSSALDNSIIAHEWGHYISNRLIGDSSGLTTNHARGLGEGWGDFHSMMLIVADADRNQPGNNNFQGAYGVAAYSMGAYTGPTLLDPKNSALFGIRRYPYSTDMDKNPLSLRHISDSNQLPTDIPTNANSSLNSQVHNTGEVWASMLWECYAALLNNHAFAEAQNRMKRYLVAGYKLTPVSPTLIEARDALLAPMQAEAPADFALCSAGFAKRGAGTLAVIPDRYSATNAGVVEDASTSALLVIENLHVSMNANGSNTCDADDVLDSGETGLLSVTVRNNGLSAISGVQLALASNLSNLTFPDGATVDLPVLSPLTSTTVTAKVALTGVTAPTSSRITATLNNHGQATPPLPHVQTITLHTDNVANRLASDDVEALPSVMTFNSTRTGYEGTWSPTAYDATALPLAHRYVGVGADKSGSHRMVTPPLAVASTGSLVVSFNHRYRFEYAGSYYYDGGQLMISTDGGSTWAPVADSHYTGTLASDSDTYKSENPAGGQRAFVGNSANQATMTAITIDLGTEYAGQTVQLAWVVHTGIATGSTGWEVDDIVISGITNTPFPQRVTDAQICTPGNTSLTSVSGQNQTTAVNTAFAQALRVRLVTVGGAPVAGKQVSFAAPTTGASATLSVSTAQTDADGYAQVSATANGISGGYSVTATAGSASASFALTNTATSGGPGGGTPLSISGAAPNGQGTVTIAVNASANPLPNNAQFTQENFANSAGVGVPTMNGYDFPFGLAKFVLQNVGTGNTVTLHITYPNTVPAQAEYWKYGKTTPSGGAHWHRIPMTLVNSHTIAITLTDGGQGDTDATADGHITDPGGLAVPASARASITAVPTLSQWALALLMMGLGWLAWPAMRAKKRAA